MLPLRIAAPSIELSPAVEAEIRDHAARLSHYYARITSCVVTIDVPERHRKNQAQQCRVRLEIGLPGGEVVINRQPRNEVRTAVQDAFAAARRRLEDYGRRQQHAVKVHEPQPVGRVSQYYPLAGYGFLEASDGHEVYFNATSVLDGGFTRLDVGTEVRFTEEAGERGPQASSVVIAAQRGAGAQESEAG